MARGVSASHSRVDTVEVKALIIRKVGHLRAEKYFHQLRKLFSCKISKSEFDRLCTRIVGRENVPLHNLFIRSIIKNACLSVLPPQKRSVKSGSALDIKISLVNQRNGFQTPFADPFCSSPRELKDHPSPVETHGKPESITVDDTTSKGKGDQSATASIEQTTGSPCVQSRFSVTAPLGISTNFHCSHQSLASNHYSETCQSSGELPDSKSLRNHLGRKLEMEGLGVTLDCVNLLNYALDAYLKRLIESCMNFGGSRCRNEHDPRQFGQSMLGSNALPDKRKESTMISLLDFCVAMELNPKILGADMATQLEKISTHCQ